MSGSGGGSYFPSRPNLEDLVSQSSKEAEQQKLDSDVNQALNDLLSEFNQRDHKETQDRLTDIENVLGEEVDIVDFRFGGSVARHTYVDGLSDVDALAILNKQDTSLTNKV